MQSTILSQSLDLCWLKHTRHIRGCCSRKTQRPSMHWRISVSGWYWWDQGQTQDNKWFGKGNDSATNNFQLELCENTTVCHFANPPMSTPLDDPGLNTRYAQVGSGLLQGWNRSYASRAESGPVRLSASPSLPNAPPSLKTDAGEQIKGCQNCRVTDGSLISAMHLSTYWEEHPNVWCMLPNWVHTQQKAVIAPMRQAPSVTHTELLLETQKTYLRPN